MARRLRVKLGENVRSFGVARIPEDRIVELSEEDAARFLRDRRSRDSVKVLGWVNDDPDRNPRVPDSFGGHPRTLAQAGVLLLAVLQAGHSRPPCAINVERAQFVQAVLDVVKHVIRQLHRVLADVMREPLRPEIDAVRQLGTSVGLAADSTPRVACKRPRRESLLQIPGDEVTLPVIPRLVHEVPRIGQVMIALAAPVPDQADPHLASLPNDALLSSSGDIPAHWPR